MNLPINVGLAILYTILIFFAAGLINEYVVLSLFGDFGGLIIDILAIVAIFKVWQLVVAKSKRKQS